MVAWQTRTDASFAQVVRFNREMIRPFLRERKYDTRAIDDVMEDGKEGRNGESPRDKTRDIFARDEGVARRSC